MLRKTFLSALTLGLLALAPRAAHAQDCALDTDCPGDEVCVDLSCGSASEPLDACDDEADCHIGSCVDGFCKRTAVQCADETGAHCQIGESSFECECPGGIGFGGSDGNPGGGEPLPEPDPEAMYDQCLDNLAMCEDIGGDGDGDGDDDGDEPVEPGDEEGGGGNGDGDGDGDGASDDEDAEGNLEDDMVGSRGCSVGGDATGPGALAFAALGLIGLRRRRRS
jgi:MYXO-CTERM domain-containing protein